VNTYLNYNGIFEDKSVSKGFIKDAFLTGDIIYEKMHANGGSIQYFNKHIANLKEGMEILKMVFPLKFRKSDSELHDEISRTLHRNRLFKGASVTLFFFRENYSDPLFYKNTSYIIDVQKLGSDTYQLNDIGLEIDIFNEFGKQISPLSKFHIGGAIHLALAEVFKKENKLDDCIITNTDNSLIESTESNIFIINNRDIITPGLLEGPVNDVLRKIVINCAKLCGFNVLEKSRINEADLLEAEEIMLVNAAYGIKWVKAFRTRRYFNKFIHEILHKLNEVTFGKTT
jgi:branched-chain amino acid aminotransferase